MSNQVELFACLYVKEFPAQALLRLRPELCERPVVIVQGNPPLQDACSCNSRARKMGVVRGMTRVELETFPSLMLLSRSPSEESAAKAVLLECAGAFSPRVEDRSDHIAFLCILDITGTEKLFGPPRTMAQEFLNRVNALGIVGSVAISTNIHAAIACVRGTSARISQIEAGNEAATLNPLSLAALDLPAHHAKLFDQWGIRTLGALAALPENELVARIGHEGRRLHLLARGKWPHLLVPFEANPSLEERMELDIPVEFLDSLLFVVGMMLEQLILRAKMRSLALASLTITLSLEGGTTHSRTVRPALATNDRQLWSKLLHMDLEAHPPQSRIQGVTLSAEEGRTSKVQNDLFSPSMPDPGRLDMTLARIRAIVGEDCVGRPVLRDTHQIESFQMEPFKVQLGKSSSTFTPKHSPAVMRKLRPAEIVSVTLRGEQPSMFVFRGRRYEVQRAYGPWLTGETGGIPDRGNLNSGI